jgi:hypothetical protein
MMQEEGVLITAWFIHSALRQSHTPALRYSTKLSLVQVSCNTTWVYATPGTGTMLCSSLGPQHSKQGLAQSAAREADRGPHE